MTVRDWSHMRAMSERLLVERTGEDVAAWKARIAADPPTDEAALRTWLAQRGVVGYAQMLLVMERFGFPDFLTADADQLIDAQYADRSALRPLFDALLAAAAGLPEVEVQARKTYVTLVTPRRTFAQIIPATRDRIDLGLRLPGAALGARLLAPGSKMADTITCRIALTGPQDLEAETLGHLRRAADANR
jgi:hypothetical protein